MSACTWLSSSSGGMEKHKSEPTSIDVIEAGNAIHLSNVI